MKDVIKKAFNLKSLEPFLVGVGVILLLEFAIFPALTIANTFINLLGGALSIGVGIFLYQYVKKKFFEDEVKKETQKEGETELDYIPSPEKKKTSKAKNKK